MTPNPNSTTQRQLAYHSRRHIPDSLTKKRCEETFDRLLREYGEEEGHEVEWALIFESGRENKMLFVSVYGWHDVFPVRFLGDGESDDDELEDENGGSGGGGTSDGTSDGVEVERGDGKNKEEGGGKIEGEDDEKSNKEDDKKMTGKQGQKARRKARKKLSEEDVKKMEKAMIQLRKKGENESIFTVTAAHTVAAGLWEEESSELLNGESLSANRDHPVVAGAADAEGSELPNEENLPANKPHDADEGYSEHPKEEDPGTDEGVQNPFSTRLTMPKKKQKEVDAGHKETYTVIGTIMDSKVEWMCDDPQYEGYEDNMTYFNRDGQSLKHGMRFHDRIKGRELALLAALQKKRDEEEAILQAEKQEKKLAKKARRKGELPPELSNINEHDGRDAAFRKREKAKAKRSRQKRRHQMEAEESETENFEAEGEDPDAATARWYKQKTGEDINKEDVASRIRVVDHNTPEGAAAVAEARRLGHLTFPAIRSSRPPGI